MFAHLSPKERWEKAFEIYRQALRAPHYAEKYAGLPAPHDAETWRALPMLERKDLLAHRYPASTAMLTVPIEGLLVIATGGSTGVARYTVFTWGEWDGFVSTQAQALAQIGLTSKDVVANLFLAGHLWPSFLGAHDAIKKLNAVELPISSNIPVEEILRLCIEFQPTALFALPTLFVFMADVAKKQGVKLERLRLLGYVGEQMSDTVQKHVREALGVEHIRPLGYSSADAGLMGYACDHCPSGTYHVPSAFQFLEIINPDTGAPAAFGEQGELVVTNLARRSMPVVRYRIGDVGRFVAGRCPCGDANPRFQMEGRAGDDFKLGGGFISMQPIEDALARFPSHLSLNFTVEIEDVDGKTDLVIRVESPEPDAAAAIVDEVGEALCEVVPEFRKGLEMGFFGRLEVHPTALGSLPRNPSSGKVKRLLDKRQSAPVTAEPTEARAPTEPTKEAETVAETPLQPETAVEAAAAHEACGEVPTDSNPGEYEGQKTDA